MSEPVENRAESGGSSHTRETQDTRETESRDRSSTSGRRSGGRSHVRGVGLTLMIVGLIFAVAGVVAYIAVQQTLSDQKITVSDDADMFAGKQVNGPFTAYSQAMVIGKHAKEIAGGKTYAELPQNDPNRDTVMTASFLQASLFTSVVAFGVAAMAIVLGLLLILMGWSFRRMAP